MDLTSKISQKLTNQSVRPTFVNTFIFLDLETTGLPSHQPRKTVQCTEISLVAVHRKHFDDKEFNFRVLNKLNVCVKPTSFVSFESTNLSGLNNHMLETQQPFSSSTATLINEFIKQMEPPVCCLAHNGLAFDFPLLKAELNKVKSPFDQNVLCADTYKALLTLIPPENPTHSSPKYTPKSPVEIASAMTPPRTPSKYPVYSPQYIRSDPQIVDLTTSQVTNVASLGGDTGENPLDLASPSGVSQTPSSSHRSEFGEPLTPPHSTTKYPMYSPQYKKADPHVIDLTTSPGLIDLTQTPKKRTFSIFSPSTSQPDKAAKRVLFPADDSVNNHNNSKTGMEDSLPSTSTCEAKNNKLVDLEIEEGGEQSCAVSSRAQSNTEKDMSTPSMSSSTEKDKNSMKQPQKPASSWSSSSKTNNGYPPRGYKLGQLFERILGEPFQNAHEAEADTLSLMKLCHRVEGFSEWVDDYAKPFTEIAPMW